MEIQWTQREIENYLTNRDALMRWALAKGNEVAGGALLAVPWVAAMEQSIDEIEAALATLGRDPWGADIKASDEFLEPLFENFFKRLGLPNLMRKSNFHEIAPFVDASSIDPEVTEVLNRLAELAAPANTDGAADPALADVSPLYQGP